MIDRTETAFGLKPKRLTADTAYGTGKLLAWLLDKDITPHIPVWERYPRTDGMFSRSDFTYDAGRDVYICPNGRPMRTSGTVHDGRVRNYLSQPATAVFASSSNDARVHRSRRLLAISMKKHATMPAHSRARRSSSDRAMRARKWKCGLRTSRSTIASSACACGGSLARATSSILRPSPRISRRSQTTCGGRPQVSQSRVQRNSRARGKKRPLATGAHGLKWKGTKPAP